MKTIHLTLWTAVKEIIKDKFITPNAYVNRKKVLKLITSASTKMKVEHKQIKYSIRKIKEIIYI